jgi:hypothetical protein
VGDQRVVCNVNAHAVNLGDRHVWCHRGHSVTIVVGTPAEERQQQQTPRVTEQVGQHV